LRERFTFENPEEGTLDCAISSGASGFGNLRGWSEEGPEREIALYLTFPVAVFWISNQAEWFEDHVI
jgi:hypothetical protein